jgi:siroheme synthase (precorrin-2 oxidase/ferrochelatase)
LPCMHKLTIYLVFVCVDNEQEAENRRIFEERKKLVRPSLLCDCDEKFTLFFFDNFIDNLIKYLTIGIGTKKQSTSGARCKKGMKVLVYVARVMLLTTK